MADSSTLLVLLVFLTLAAILDIRLRVIPNWLTLVGVFAACWFNARVPGLFFTLTGLLVGFGVYFVLYALHTVGAGDVKLAGMVGAFVGWPVIGLILVVSALLGGIVGLAWRTRATLPHGAVIAAGTGLSLIWWGHHGR